MTKVSGAQAVVDCLIDEGVEYVFSLPGDSTVPLVDVFSRTSQIKYVCTRHEQIAVHMADGYARASGKIGVVIVTRSGGASNIMIGLVTAYSSNSPLLVIAGDTSTATRGRSDFQEFDMTTMFKPVTKFCERVERASRIHEVVRRAIKIAHTGMPGPVFVAIPHDLLREECESRRYSSEEYRVSAKPRPDPGALARAVSLILDAEKPAIIAGNLTLVYDASEELSQFASLLSIPVTPASYTPRSIIPTDHPSYLWEKKDVDDADILLVVGTNMMDFAEELFWSKVAESAKIIQIEPDPIQIAKVYPAHIGIVANPKDALKEMMEMAKSSLTGTRRLIVERRAVQLKEKREKFLEGRWPTSDWDAIPIRPWRLIKDIRESLDRNAIIAHDSGSFSTSWIRRCFDFYEPKTDYACMGGVMGFGLPGALGVKLAKSHRQVINIEGDGSFMMVWSALDTAANYEIPITIIINNNSAFMQIKRQLRPPYLGVDLKNPDFAKVAQLFGIYAERVENPAGLKAALERAMEKNRQGKPALIDVITTNDPMYANPEIYFGKKSLA